MKPISFVLLAFTSLIAASLRGQTDIRTTIDPSKAAATVAIAIPFPDVVPPANVDTVREAFFGPLTRDLAASGVFSITPLPPNIPPSIDLAKRVNAQLLLKMTVRQQNLDYIVEAPLVDTTGMRVFGKSYRGVAAALTLIAHRLADELVMAINGRPGIFRSRIAFASNRDGVWEIYLMDWDGGNQRRITHDNGMALLPSWSPDNERLVYTTFSKVGSDMVIIHRLGGGRIRLRSGLGLNTSATFSPVGNDIAFVGSIGGNPDIYLIRDDGTSVRRLTSATSIESTPEWSPNGRQISFTSGRSGTPQIYVMDAEGTNVRRISFEGEWNDDATWSPDGDQIAYTSRVNGRFQIRIASLATGESRIVAGEGSNEQPTWSPDGRWIAFQSNRSGRWQVYRMRVDGTDLQQLTSNGENKEPDWSKKSE